MAKRAVIVIFLVTLIFVMGVELSNKPARRGSVLIGGKTIRVEVARTPEQREQGLSGRTVLPEDTGMLFIFEKPDFYGFWMKKMNFSIDIIWIGRDYKIVDVSADVSPLTFPRTFLPKEPAQFVLEVPSGWVNFNKISVGDPTKFSL